MELNPECLVAEDIFWHETEYRSNFNVKPMELHHKAGPPKRNLQNNIVPGGSPTLPELFMQVLMQGNVLR